MNINTNAVSRPLFRTALVLQKHAPTLAFVGGVAGVVTSTVLACKATLHLYDELEVMSSRMEQVRGPEGEPEAKELAVAYTQNAITIVKLYGPAVIVGAASITALTTSHITLTRRNAGLTAGYAALSKAYDDYRGRVRAELGEDREANLYRGTIPLKSEGKDAPRAFDVGDPNTLSPYSRFFDELSSEWQKNAELNRLFVQCQQSYLNHRLQAHGHVFLNEAYDALGLERSQAGAVVGWIISEDGDNFIDFGIFEVRNNRFVNGVERAILLDFNVDGVIYDKI